MRIYEAKLSYLLVQEGTVEAVNTPALVVEYANQSALRGERKEALLRDLADFLTHKNMQKHWELYGKFYPDSFQDAVNDIIKKEPPSLAALKDARGES